MNKQELIYKIEKLPYNLGPIVDTMKINRAGLIKLIEQLDEPKKVKVPRFVADWIEKERKSGGDLEDLFNDIVYEQDHIEWFREEENMNLVARAWLDGYEIKPEKRYTVKVRANGEYLNWGVMNNFYFSKKGKTYFVKSKLENAGFDWVFDCPGIEVEEVG